MGSVQGLEQVITGESRAGRAAIFVCSKRSVSIFFDKKLRKLWNLLKKEKKYVIIITMRFPREERTKKCFYTEGLL